MCRKASSLDGTMSEETCGGRLTYMFSDQPSFDWKLVRWTGKALVSLFQSRSSMILWATLRNRSGVGVKLTYIKNVSRAMATDIAGVFPT